MTITFTPSSTGVTLDETGGLQFNGSAGNTVPTTDNDDKDLSLATLLAQQANFYNRLFTDFLLSQAFATANGVAFGSIGTATSTTPITSITPSFTIGAASGLFTTTNKELFLYGTALDPNIVLLREANGSGNADPNGAIAAAIYLKVDVDGTQTSEDVSVWMVQFEALKSPNTATPDETLTLANLSLNVGAVLEFTFEGAPSGQNYFMMFGGVNGALLVSGRNPVDDTVNINFGTGDTVNSSQGGGGTTLGSNNQAISTNNGVIEGLHFRFIIPADTDPNTPGTQSTFLVPNLDQNEADVEANTLASGFINTTSATISFVQTAPHNGSFTAKFTAFTADEATAQLETGMHFGEELEDDIPVPINIAGVQVLRNGVNVVGTQGVAVTINGNGVNVSGLIAGDDVKYVTNGMHNHVLVEYVSGATFDIGGVAISQSETMPFAITNIKFDDDAPTIALTNDGQVTHDESAGLQTQADGDDSTTTEDDNDSDVAAASIPAALSARLTALGLSGQIGQATSGTAVVTATGGTDGVASLSLAIKLAGASGLSAVNGGAVTLAVDAQLSNLVIGKDTQGDTVVAIYLGSDGKVTIVQYEALVNPTAGNGTSGTHDEQIDINDGVLFAVVTDGDGDKAEVDIGDRVNFEDDGPSITTTGTEPTATVDETDLTTNATADFSVNFTSSFGTDGAGTLAYTLGVSALGGVDSGLVDTATNNSVFLFLEGGVVFGREGTNAADAVAGDIVFTVSVDSTTGVVTLDQQRAIVHPNTDDPDDSKTLAADTLITLTATKTDGDSDTAAATLNIAQNLNFEDDGPSITTTGEEPTATVDETILATNATADFSVNFTSSFGADDAGTLTYALGVSATDGVDSGLVDTATGNSVFLFNEAGVIIGREGTNAADAVAGDIAFTASINTTTGVVTLDQQRALIHLNAADPDDSKTLAADTLITLTATKTDKDGDSASAFLNIAQNLVFEDDGPSADIADGGGVVTVDESAGNQDDDSDAAPVAALFAGVVNQGTDLTTPEFAISTTPLVTTAGSLGGADGLQSAVLSLAVLGGDGTDSLLDTTDGKNILLFKEGDLIVGRYDVANGAVTQADPAAFAIALQQDGNAAVAQYVSLAHLDATNHDDRTDLTGLINALVVVTDGDGDQSNDSFGIGDKINFDDDGPSAAIALGTDEVTVDESPGLQTGGDSPTPNEDDNDNDVLGTTAFKGSTLAAVFGVVASPGSDGPSFPQYALSGGALVTTTGSSGGEDGIKSSSLSLAVNGGDGTDSLLDTTAGKSIFLYKEGDLVVGRYDADSNAGTGTGGNEAAAFAIAIDNAGKVATSLFVSLDHPTTTNHDDAVDLTGMINALVTITDNDDDTATSTPIGIGDKINFEDDGPTLDGVQDSTNSLLFAAGVSETKPYTFTSGADNEALAGVALVDFTNPDNAGDLAASGLGALETLLGKNITAQQVGNTVTYYTPDGNDAGTDPDPLFQFAATNTGWTFTILQDLPLVFNAFDFSTLASGGPKEILSLAATNSNTVGVFNGYLFGPLDAPNGTESRGTFPPAPQDFPADPKDDLNPDNLGFGVKQGAASNMNNNEGFSLTLHDGTANGPLTTVEGLQFKIDQQGNTDDVVMSFELVNGAQGDSNDPNITTIETGGSINLITSKLLSIADDGDFWLRLGLPQGNADIKFTILDDDFVLGYTPQANEIVIYTDGVFDTAYFRMAFPNNGTFNQYPGQVNDSVRIKDLTLIEQAPIPDLELQFAMQGTDGDGDLTLLGVANVFVSEDGSTV